MTTAVGSGNDAANTTVFDEDASIPVLTERLTLPALDLDFALPVIEPVPAAEPSAAMAAPSIEPTGPPGPTLPTAEQLRDAVLAAVLDQLPAQIDALLRRSLRPAIDAAIAHLSAEADRALREVLAEVVERAVRDALDAKTPDRE